MLINKPLAGLVLKILEL